MATIAKTPEELLKRDFEKLTEWREGRADRTPTVAVGALGELIASKTLRLPIVSSTVVKYDLSDEIRTVEVKTRTRNNRMNLGSKECGEVALVRLSRRKNSAGENAIRLDSVRTRCADKASAVREWREERLQMIWLPRTEEALIAALAW